MNVKVIVGLGLVVVLVLAFVFLVPVEDGMNADNSQKNLKQTDITSSQQPEKLPESVRPPTKSPFQHSSSKPETGHQTVSPADDKPARLVKPPVDPQPPESPSPDKKALPKLEQGPTPLRALLESDGATEKNLVLHGKKISQDEIDRLMVWGTDRDSLQGAIREQHGEFHRCYNAWLAVEPDLNGTLRIGLTIGKSHESDTLASIVGLEVLNSEVDHAVFEGCVVGALQNLVFEQVEENITVNYPLTFSRKDQ